MTSPITPFTDYDLSALPAPRTVSWYYNYSSLNLVTGIGLITAITFVSTAATAASLFHVRDGTDDTGQIIAVIGGPPGGASAACPAPPGILFRLGLRLTVSGGVGSGTITYIPLLSQP